jgi:hypothetical protein
LYCADFDCSSEPVVHFAFYGGGGVTDACQDDVRELEDKMKDNKDDYTAESRRKAKTHLLGAKTNRLNPVKCRKNILDAREELRKGKRDKKKKD